MWFVFFETIRKMGKSKKYVSVPYKTGVLTLARRYYNETLCIKVTHPGNVERWDLR